MSKVKATPVRPEGHQCETCHARRPNYDMVNSRDVEGGRYRLLCSRCHNKEVAEATGLAGFEDARFDPMSLPDSTGRSHEFHFRTNLFVPGVAIDAFELRHGNRGGYSFQIIGDPKEDLLVLFGRLIEKMRRALAIQHLERGEDGQLRIADDFVVRARIEWNEEEDEGRTPMLIIDGREIDWDEFGRMLMTFQGWQFKLNIADGSEEL